MGIIAAAVAVYIHTTGSAQDSMSDWLNVVLPKMM
jgi:PiT family inorganic phosphate transporter